MNDERASSEHDVAVLGGGAAGLSAALVLGRARRRVVVIDAGQPRKAPAAHMHGYLSRDGMPPAQLLAAGRVTVAESGQEFAFNRNGPGIGSYTWRYVMEPTPAGTRVTESFDAERPLGAAMTWLTEKWTGSSNRDADLRRGMTESLSHLRVEAERA